MTVASVRITTLHGGVGRYEYLRGFTRGFIPKADY